MEALEYIFVRFAEIAWGYPLLALLLGGGLFFLITSRFVPYRHLGHSVEILTGKYDDPRAEGDINHFQALSSALAATVGMGNISGVAIAIVMGGPGAIFWMWISALVGMATKFFTCALAVMYRGPDSSGKIQGGAMYYIREGLGNPDQRHPENSSRVMYAIREFLGRNWKKLAYFFAFCGLVGASPMFQSNQLTQLIREDLLIPFDLVQPDAHFMGDFIMGLIIVAIVSLVIFGGIKRIGAVAARLVPLMVLLYCVSVIYIILSNIQDVPQFIGLIITDAFTGTAAAGGAVGTVIITGIRRGAFSNEAGIGMETLAHGAAKTKEPIREGLVAMMEPAIDTLLVCTMTALAILLTGVWIDTDADGITLTAMAFNEGVPIFGSYVLVACVIIFSMTTMFTYSYYGTKCLGFLAGAEWQFLYNYFYIASILFGSIATIHAVISLIDGFFALMAIPTTLTAILLAPKVYTATVDYFRRKRSGEMLADLERAREEHGSHKQ